MATGKTHLLKAQDLSQQSLLPSHGTGTQSLRDDADWPATVTKQVRYGIGSPGSCIPGDQETGSVTKRGERGACVCVCVCVLVT